MSDWTIKGELILNCNCTVFCPCVVSMGKHSPTEGYCQTWFAIHVDEGRVNGETIDGMNIAMMIDIPGRMTEGNWTSALYVDEAASDTVITSLEDIFQGKAGGSTRVMGLLTGNYLGVKKMPIKYEKDGAARHVNMGKIIDGHLEPVASGVDGKNVEITNTQYWIGPDITVYQSNKSKFRDFGRVWDLSGRSAELVNIDWKG